jgi:hypothetical protein
MNFFKKMFSSPTNTQKNKHKSRSTRRRHVGGSQLSPADFSAGSDSSASEYMLKTVGNVSDQLNNAGNTNTIHPLSGGRNKGGRRRRSRGGFMGEVLNQAAVPAALVGMSLYKGKRGNTNRKSYKGGFMGEVLNQAAVPAALVGMSLYKGRSLQSGRSRRNGRSRKNRSMKNE